MGVVHATHDWLGVSGAVAANAESWGTPVIGGGRRFELNRKGGKRRYMTGRVVSTMWVTRTHGPMVLTGL